MGKREEEAAAKRERVESSAAFRMWWEERKKMPHRPTDAYHAYQTDKGIKAEQAPLKEWKKAPNQSDIGSVDSPGGYSRAPAQKPKQVPIKHQQYKQETPKSTPLPKESKRRDVTIEVEKLTQKYGVPTPEISFSNQGSLTGKARTGVVLSRSFGLTKLHQGKIYVGISGASRGMRLAAAAHEAGHVIHAQQSAKGFVWDKKQNISPYSATHRSYADETAAWKLAEPMLKNIPRAGGQQAQARWLKAFALKTYRSHGSARIEILDREKKSYRYHF